MAQRFENSAVFFVLCLAFACVVCQEASPQVQYQTIVRQMREAFGIPETGSPHTANQANNSKTSKFLEIREHLLKVLRTPGWRQEFYRLIRLINTKSNATGDESLPSSSPSASASARATSRPGAVGAAKIFERKNTSRYVYRSAAAKKNASLARRLAARARRGRTVRCPKLYQEAYCVYGECELTMNFKMLICRCPSNASGEHCELRKLDQCFDHSGRRVVEQRRKTQLYSEARQPIQVVIEHSFDRAPLTLRTNEEVSCSRKLCENRGACTEVPGVTFHCECDDGYGEKTCNSFIVYHLLRELWEAEDARRIAQNEDIDLIETELRLIDGFADAVCAQRWDGRCRDEDDITIGLE